MDNADGSFDVAFKPDLMAESEVGSTVCTRLGMTVRKSSQVYVRLSSGSWVNMWFELQGNGLQCFRIDGDRKQSPAHLSLQVRRGGLSETLAHRESRNLQVDSNASVSLADLEDAPFRKVLNLQ